jgi:hypothetical protein
MSIYAAERYLPGVTPGQLLDAARRAERAAAEMTAAGTPVTYLRSTFLTGDQTCYCLFEGPSEQAVAQANDKAGIPYERIVAAMHVASGDLA